MLVYCFFFSLWNNAFLVSFKGFNMLQGYPEREEEKKKKKERKGKG